MCRYGISRNLSIREWETLISNINSKTWAHDMASPVPETPNIADDFSWLYSDQELRHPDFFRTNLKPGSDPTLDSVRVFQTDLPERGWQVRTAMSRHQLSSQTELECKLKEMICHFNSCVPYFGDRVSRDKILTALSLLDGGFMPRLRAMKNSVAQMVLGSLTKEPRVVQNVCTHFVSEFWVMQRAKEKGWLDQDVI